MTTQNIINAVGEGFTFATAKSNTAQIIVDLEFNREFYKTGDVQTGTLSFTNNGAETQVQLAMVLIPPDNITYTIVDEPVLISPGTTVLDLAEWGPTADIFPLTYTNENVEGNYIMAAIIVYAAGTFFDVESWRFSKDSDPGVDPTAILRAMEIPIFHDLAGLDAADLDALTKAVRDTYLLNNSIHMDFRSRILKGLDLAYEYADSKHKIYVTPGLCIILDIASDYSYCRGWVGILALKTLAGEYTDDDLINDKLEKVILTHEEYEWGDTDDESKSTRIFLKHADGFTPTTPIYPIRQIVQQITTRKRTKVVPSIIPYTEERNATVKIGYVLIYNGAITVYDDESELPPDSGLTMPERDPATLQRHREVTPIDHPDGSVTPEKLSPEILGLWEQETSLTIERIVAEINGAKGIFNSINERLIHVVDENGRINRASFEEAVQAIVDERLLDIIDENNQLRASAVRSALGATGDEASQIAVRSGTVTNGMSIKIPEGYSFSECDIIVSPATWRFVATTGVTNNVEMVCQQSGGIVASYVKVIDGATEIIYPCDANYLVIAKRSA